MKTEKERENAFRKDFEELLQRHKAEFTLTDDGRGYGLHRPVALIEMMSEFNESGDKISEYTEFELY